MRRIIVIFLLLISYNLYAIGTNITFYDWGGGFGAYTKFEITIGD